ncbi:MAG: hypothetical protein Q4G67_14155 [Actinomycetia bacterium]|nr:hypothetical protein [Actinomycetes bacterium]
MPEPRSAGGLTAAALNAAAQNAAGLNAQELTPERGLLFVYALALLVFGAVWLWFAVPFVRALLEAHRTRDPWSPFTMRPDGTWPFIVRLKAWSPFRAPHPEQRNRAGLIVRWGLWTIVAVGTGIYPMVLIGNIIDVLRSM